MEHESHPEPEHQTGNGCPFAPAQHGLPLHGEWTEEPDPSLRSDIVLPKFRTVVFVHGCFWHGHEHCADFRLPETRREWWRNKIEGNRARDAWVESELQSLGWHVVTIWECALKSREWLEQKIPKLIGEG